MLLQQETKKGCSSTLLHCCWHPFAFSIIDQAKSLKELPAKPKLVPTPGFCLAFTRSFQRLLFGNFQRRKVNKRKWMTNYFQCNPLSIQQKLYIRFSRNGISGPVFEKLQKLKMRISEWYFNNCKECWESFRKILNLLMRFIYFFLSLTTKRIWTHCSKSSFFVQNSTFDFPRKLSTFLGEKLVKIEFLDKNLSFRIVWLIQIWTSIFFSCCIIFRGISSICGDIFGCDDCGQIWTKNFTDFV